MINPDCLNVSRETEDRLRAYAALLEKWNAKINLIGRSTVEDIWNRHIRDSLQVVSLAPPQPRVWADLGSGGGLPGIVAAIVLADTPTRFHLIEADRRKATFLRETIRQLRLNAEVHSDRIEKVNPLRADVVSARALAPLVDLCLLAHPHLAQGSVCIFPKGKSWADEVTDARLGWRFDISSYPSETSADSAILVLKDLAHV